LSAFRNVYHKESKNFDLQSCVNTSKEKPNTTKESLELWICLVTSHLVTMIVVRCSPTQFYMWQKLNSRYGTFCPSKQKSGNAGC